MRGLVGATIGHYRLVSVISEGRTGTVYLAEHPLIGKRVALEVVDESIASDVTEVARLFASARALAGLGHPNLVDVLDFGRVVGEGAGPSFIYVIREHLEGASLAEVLRGGPLPAERALAIAASVADAMAAAEAAGVPCGVSPAEIVLDGRGGRETPKLKVDGSGAGGTVAGLLETTLGRRPTVEELEAIRPSRAPSPPPPDEAAPADPFPAGPTRRPTTLSAAAGQRFAKSRPPGLARAEKQRRAGLLVALVCALLAVGIGVHVAITQPVVSDTTPHPIDDLRLVPTNPNPNPNPNPVPVPVPDSRDPDSRDPDSPTSRFPDPIHLTVTSNARGTVVRASSPRLSAPASRPLAIPRSSTPIDVTISAPGHRSIRRTITPSVDVSIDAVLQRLPRIERATTATSTSPSTSTSTSTSASASASGAGDCVDCLLDPI